MPTVPTYSLPQEQERALPGARRESLASPAMLDASAEGEVALGKGLQNAGAGLEAVAYSMAQRQIAADLSRALSDDKQAFTAYSMQVQKERQGNAAKGVTADTAVWWKDRISKNLDGMQGALKDAYKRHALDLQDANLRSISQFEVQQTEIGQTQDWQANKVNTINLAAANPDAVTVAKAIKDLRQWNAYRAAEKKWSPEVLQAQNEQDITQLHRRVIQALAATNKDAALDYYRAHESEIAGSARAELGQLAEKATATAIGSRAAQAVWAEMGPKNDTDASDIDKMKQRIRDELKDNTFARDAALHEISQIDADRDKGIRARDARRTATVNEMLMQGMSLAAVQQTPAWIALDGTERRKITEHEEAIAATRESRAAARESRAFTAESRAEARLNREGLDEMIRLSDPDKLVAMSRDDVMNLRPVIGAQNTLALLNKWDAYTKNGTALSEGKIDNDQFNVFAQRAGLDPFPKASDTDAKQRVVDLRDKVERMIGAEQQARKRPLTREEKDALMQREIDNTVIQHSKLWFDKPVPALALPPDKQADAYVIVNGQEVKLSSIPATERAAIIRARRSAGLPVTEQAIAEMWVKKNAKGK